MADGILSSVLGSIQCWLTPTVIFVLINAAVITIAFFSSKQQPETRYEQQQHQNPLVRSSSHLLQKFRSLSIYHQNTPLLDQHFPTPVLPNFESEPPTSPPPNSEIQYEAHISRVRYDTRPTVGEAPTKLTQKTKKSTSEDSAFGRFQCVQKKEVGVKEKENKSEGAARASIVRRGVELRGDAAVDAKADDFISRFKQQLKLQRLDSLLSYREMLNRGR